MDIGANIGVYSLNCFRKAKAVYAFEATKSTYDKFAAIIKENHIENIHLYFNAVDDKDNKKVTIFMGDSLLGGENNGANSMHKGNVLANVVDTITIDSFIENNNILSIDIIKIDIEGNELYALKGGKKSIQKFKPVIFCEINPELNNLAGYSPAELYDFMIKELGYTAKKIANNKFRIIKKHEVISRQQNVFFFPSNNNNKSKSE